MMRWRKIVSGVGLLACAVTAQGDKLAVQARAVVAQHEDAVVTIELVMETAFHMEGFGSEKEEDISETTGTVITPEGMVILSHTSIDPTAQYSEWFDMDEDGMRIDSELQRITIHLSNGDEVDGQLLLVDRDLDLALIAPKEPLKKEQPYVDLTKSAALEQFDPAVVLDRMGKVARRACAGYITRIYAVIPKPRTLYAIDAPGGCPVFDLEGAVVGMVARRAITSDAAASSFFDSFDNEIWTVIRAEDLLAFIEQASKKEKGGKAEGKT